MNKNRYRVIFSQARGLFIAVAEIVKSRTKAAGQSAGPVLDDESSQFTPNSYKRLNPLNFAVISVLGAVVYTMPLSGIANTQIIADKSAPNSQQATILNSSNGVTQVNIQTPSAGGVSRNTYTQFDVGQKGAILNNSRNNAQTQLGGWVQGNPWLAGGEAKVILNEVNSSNPSQLKGYLEVAGKSAQVVIANPSGLVCDGCGVINADRFTLTTGQAVMNQGYLESFRVRDGQVTIAGKGLDGSLTPYTDIYTRALNVNAGLYANNLNVVLGQNDVNIKDQVTPQINAVTSGSGDSNKPNFALDVGQLGGMYAGKIFLVGNEHGLGVRNAGSINATSNQLTLNSNGDLINTGNIIANKDQVQLNAQNIQNTGNISSATSWVTVQSQNLDNSGLISTADELHLQNKNVMTNTGKLNAARIVLDTDSLKNSGSIEQTGLQAFDVKAGQMTNIGGKIGIPKPTDTGETGTGGGTTTEPTVPTDPSQDGGSLGVVTTEDITPKTYDKGYIHVKNNFNNDSGAIVANGGVDLDSSNGLNNQDGQLNLGTVNIKGDDFNNDRGQLTVKQADIQTQRFSNQAGHLASNQALKIQANSANNQKGKIQSVEQLDINIANELNNAEGQIASHADVNVVASNLNNTSGVVYSEEQGVQVNAYQAIDNTAGLIQAKTNLNLNSTSLNNTSGQIIADQITQKHTSVNNTEGSIVANQDLSSIVQQFDNNLGQIQAKSVQLNHDQLNNSGSIYADQDLTFTGQNLQNSGSLAAGQNLSLNSSTLQNDQEGLIAAGLDRDGKLSDSGNLSIQVDQADLHGQTFAGNNLNVSSKNNINASNGQLQAQNVTLQSKTGSVSTEAATVIAKNQLSIDSQDLINNHKGQLSAQNLSLNAKQLDNRQGQIQHIATDDLNLNFVKGLNNQDGTIQSNANNINLTTTTLNNESGKLIHAGKQKLNLQLNSLQGSQGQILSNGELELNADQVVLDGATTSADQINITANSLSHQKGQLLQSGTMSPLALAIKKELNNLQGVIAGQKGLDIQAGAINNQSGQLLSGQGDLNLGVLQALDNSHAGQIVSGTKTSIQAGSVNNSQKGQISAIDSLTISSLNDINNASGQIVANQDVSIKANGLDNHLGQIGTSQGKLEIDTGSGILNNSSGSIQAEKDLMVKAGSIQNQSGLINSQSALGINSGKGINNDAGQIIAKQNVSLNGQGLSNNAGTIGSIEGNIKLDTGAGDLSNQSGKIQSAQDLAIKAQHIDNQSGLISAQKRLALDTQGLNNKKGQIQSGDVINITGQNLNNQGGAILTNADLTLSIDGILDNSLEGKLSGKDTKISSGSIDNSGKGQINAKDNLSITSQQSINNQTGVMAANQDVRVQSQGLDNTSGQIGSVQGQLDINAGQATLQNTSGSLQAGGLLNLSSHGLTNDSGNIVALGDSTILTTGDLSNQSGRIASNGTSSITTENLNNHAGKIQSGDHADLTLNVKGALNSSAGQIHGGNKLNIQSTTLDNSQKGQISAQNALNIKTTGKINNQTGQILSNQSVDIGSQGLDNDQGQIASIQDGLKLDAGNQILSNRSGLLQAKADLTTKAVAIDNSSGQISSQGKIDLSSQQAIINQKGLIVGEQSVDLDAQGINNNQGQIGTQGNLTVNTGKQALQNQSGILQSGQDLQVVTGGLDNSVSGQISSQGSLNIQSIGLINNNTGLIAANRDAILKGQGIGNSQGKIGSVDGSLSLNAGNGLLNNQSGSLQAAQLIKISANGVNNQSGQIIGLKSLVLDSQNQQLNNQKGVISSDQVDISSGQLNNEQGLIQANSGISIDTHHQDLVNVNSGQQGGILSQGNVTLNNVAKLDNSQGYVASGKALEISANQTENSAGLLTAGENLKIQGIGQNQLLNNQSGQISSMGNMQLNIEQIKNQGKQNAGDANSQIIVSNQLTINSKQLDNQNSQGDDANTQGIHAGSLDLTADMVNNQSGEILSRQDANLKISQQLNNQSGRINSVNALNIQGDALAIDNAKGQLLAGSNLDIKAKSLAGDGQVLSLGDAEIQLKESYQQSVDGQLQANNNLSLSTEADIINDGKINAGNKLELKAANISNTADASIESHDTNLVAKGQINNTGLINGDYTTLKADTVNNIGTGRMYGTDVAIGAVTLNNLPDASGKAPIIASRGDMNLGVKVLNNLANTADYASQAQIFSAGGLYLGGALDDQRKATGQADVINNESATIESLGDMRLSAKQINNINKHFTTELVEVDRQDNLEKFYWGWYNFDGTKIRGMNPKEDWSKYTYSEIIYETQTLESAPGQIKAGGNMLLIADNIMNDKSQILAGGELKVEGGTIHSDDTKGIRKVVDKGTQELYWKYESHDYNPFEISSETGIDLSIAQAIGHYALNQENKPIEDVSGSKTADVVIAQDANDDINALKAIGNNTTVNQDGLAKNKDLGIDDSGSVQTDVKVSNQDQDNHQIDEKDHSIQVLDTEEKQGISADQAKGKATANQTIAPDQTGTGEEFEIRTIDGQKVKVPNNALYRVSGDKQSGYLVETDPAFTNYNQWLSSDYMLKALGLDPAMQQKRIGDGFYEQRMVQDQIANLTGYRFLEGYATDEEQYKALMNNGVTYAKLYGLQPGIALTAAQIAQLTSDIVWLVEKDVTLPDGSVTRALVPQVYVKARVGDLKGDGTLLAGNSVSFKLGGDLINSATIAGREAVQITADNVNNLSGRIQGNTVGITTQNDLNNIGGQIKANDAMALNVGGNLNLTTTTRTSESEIGGFSSSVTGLDRIAGLYVGNGVTVDPDKATLVVDVAGNTVLKGAEISNISGATVLNTKGNVDIGTVETGYKLTSIRDARNSSVSQKTQDVGSQLNSSGSLLVNGQNINIKGSSLNSEQGTAQLSATDHLNIEEGRQTSQLDSQWHSKHKGTLSSKTETGYLHETSDEAIASTVTGKDVSLSGNNIDIRGSQVIADNTTQIQAKENINITTAENTYTNQYEQTVKKSGFTASLSDGVASVGYGKSSLNTKDDGQSTTLTQSVIGSKTGDTTIIAGKDLTAEAAILSSGKDLNLQGANVNLNTGYESNEQHSEVHSKNSGISVGITYSPIAAAASSYKKNTENGQFSDSAVGQVMQQANAIDKAFMAAKTPIVFTAGSHKSDQTSDSSTTQAVVTQAKAAGNLNIIATAGNINSQGAQLSAEGDALLHAKDTINLAYATDHQEQTASSKQSGFSIDTRDWLAPAGVYNDKQKGSAEADKVTGTQLSVGGKTILQTEQGDINILGSSVASQGDVNLNAARDINIKSTQNSQSQSESSKSSGIGSAQISDTEQFYGYMKGGSQSNSNSIEQQRSQVGSLEGNVNIQAGNNYNQQVADVIANKDINITAKKINVLEDKNTGSTSSSSDDLKIGIFKRISSPILDLLGAGDKLANNSQADDRTLALQAIAVGAQGYQSYSDIKGGSFAKAEAGIGFSTSKSKQTSSYATSQQNSIKAGRNVNLTSTEGDIHLQNTQVNAKEQISLDAAKNILLESGQSQLKADGKNRNAGLSAGVGASVGAETGVYIYAEAGYGKGSNHLDSNTHSQTTLDAGKVSLKSKGDTTLAGATATANRIDADVGGKLSIISQQDKVEQDIDQAGIGGRVQASLGSAWQASGNVNQSNAKGSSNGVNEQSGLFAGDGGYHVNADSVDLKGGAIVSTATKDNNDLTANSLTFSNIENKSSYDASTVSLSGGTSFNKDKAGSTDGKASNPTNNDNWRNATSFSPSLPQQESDKDSSTTYATLSDGNITIGGKQTTVEQLGIHSDAATANQKIDSLPNLQNILDNQKSVADATSTIAAAVRTYSQNQQIKAEEAKKNAEKEAIAELKEKGGADWEEYQSKTTDAEKQKILADHFIEYQYASDEAQAWGMGGDKSRAVNAVTVAITGALGGQTDLQVVANTLAPYAAQQIGDKFGHGEDKNQAAQLVSHAILGAVLAYVNNGNSAAGGSAAVASEAAAIYLTNQYKDKKEYQNDKGEFIPNLLPEDVKTQIRDLTAAIGAVVGGTVGDSAFNAQIAGVVGQNAVENNVDSIKDYQDAKKNSDTMYKSTCAALGLSPSDPACGQYIRKEGLEILKGTAMVFIPTEPYELLPLGKGVAVVLKGTKKVIAVFKDVKAAENAVEKAGAKIENNVYRDDDLWSNRPSGKREIASGLVGTDFEKWLKSKYGGSGSFNKGGREFDGSIGNTNRWYEAKSGNYWKDQTQTPQKLSKFKSDMGARKKIAESNGATYELHSNTPIPQNIKSWLSEKGIPFYEHQ